jgi:hypothetical protein
MATHQSITRRMQRSLRSLAASSALLFSVSCAYYAPPTGYPDPAFPQQAPTQQNRFGYNGSQSPEGRTTTPPPRERTPRPPQIKRDPNNTTVDVSPPPQRKPKPDTTRASEKPENPVNSEPRDSTPPPPKSETETKPATKPSPKEDLPYGIPIPTKAGMVYSPFATDRGQVDVAGLARGTRVKCPFTQKHFRVP